MLIPGSSACFADLLLDSFFCRKGEDEGSWNSCRQAFWMKGGHARCLCPSAVGFSRTLARTHTPDTPPETCSGSTLPRVPVTLGVWGTCSLGRLWGTSWQPSRRSVQCRWSRSSCSCRSWWKSNCFHRFHLVRHRATTFRGVTPISPQQWLLLETRGQTDSTGHHFQSRG